jgi:hypothetical protein
MQTSFIFKPKYGIEIIRKVLGCFINDYLCWHDNGYSWDIRKVDSEHEGWLTLEAYPEEHSDYFTETSFEEDPITPERLTEDMMVLLTEKDGPASMQEFSDGKSGYSLYEVEIHEVVAALSEVGTRVYSPYGGEKIFSIRVGDGEVRRESLLDMLLSKETA